MTTRAAVLMVGLSTFIGCLGQSRKTVLQSAVSPDGNMIAQVNSFDPGAMGGPWVDITVVPNKSRGDNPGTMFAAGYCQIADIRWTGNRNLHVDHNCHPSDVELAVLKKDGITMEYAEAAEPPIHSTFVP